MRRLRLTSLLILLFASTLLGADDLSVGWIARTPRIDYVWGSPNPTVDGWPAEGSAVTWVANVRWLGNEPLTGVSYRWTIDGAEVQHGTLDFPPRSLIQAQLPWTWTFARHEIAFEIDTDDRIVEMESRNNRLLVYSNAIGIGLYVEGSFWDQISPRLVSAHIGATTFDDWMQIQVRHFNEMARYASFPEAPEGVVERWRIDDIHVVDDDALPLAPPYPEARDWGARESSFATIYPNVLDHTVDIQWGFPARSVDGWNVPPGYSQTFLPWILTIGNSLIHEWSHARTMIDVYAWSLSSIGDVVTLNPAPPARFGYYYYNAVEQGLMHLNWGHLDRYTAAAMNQMSGRRAVRGNYNEPWDLGWFLNDLPARNRIRLLRPDGTPIARKKVYLHRPTGEPVANWTELQACPMVIPDTQGTALTTDSDGRVEVGQNPFADGKIFAYVEKANGTVVLEVEDGKTTRWAFLESLNFNLAYWNGHKDLADYDVITDGLLCVDHLGPSRVEPVPEAKVNTPDVTLRFSAAQGVKYELYYAVNGGDPVEVDVPVTPIDGPNLTSVRLSLPEGHIVWWFVEANSTPPCPPQLSSLYAFDHIVTQRWRSVTR